MRIALRSFQIQLLTAILLLTVVNSFIFAQTQNWSKWKGPLQTGESEETGWNPQFLNKPLKVNWQVNVGLGYSNVSIEGNYLYTMGYDKKSKQNNLYCLNVATGQEVWKDSYKNSKGSSYSGPKSTPIVDNQKVYSFSQDGDLFCHDALNGKVIWKRQIVEELGFDNLRWTFSSSVCIDGDLAIINAGQSGLAFNKTTGKLIWKSAAVKGNYATPVLFTQNNEKFALISGKEDVFAVRVNDGKVKWSYPWDAKYNIIAADPVFYKNKVFISTGYGVGCILLDISKGRPVQLWRNKNLKTHFSTAIVVDDYIYGIDGNAGSGELKCLDIKDGSVKWEQDNGFGSIIISNGHIIMVNERGSLFVIKISPEKYIEVSSKQKLIKKLCWTAPVLCRSNIYLRNSKGDIISINAE